MSGKSFAVSGQGSHLKSGNFTGGNKFLKLISGSKPLIIKALDGSQTFANARKTVFKEGVERWLRKAINEPSKPTPEIPVLVYEQISLASIYQMFTSLSEQPALISITQAQIVEFCISHKDWLNGAHQAVYNAATLFVCNKGGNIFVADVHNWAERGLSIESDVLENNHIESSENGIRLVVPVVTSLTP